MLASRGAWLIRDGRWTYDGQYGAVPVNLIDDLRGLQNAKFSKIDCRILIARQLVGRRCIGANYQSDALHRAPGLQAGSAVSRAIAALRANYPPLIVASYL